MIKNISIDLLVPFENHPFKKRSGIEQQELTESIKENGLLETIIVRSFPAGKYEIISGHRRVEACKALGITNIPMIIKELTKDEAIVQMVDSNIHREHILPSEKAFAYKMKSEALKHQGKTSCQLGTKSRTDEKIAETVDDSARQIQRYIRLTYLIPELLKLVDEERIAFTPAVEISYLSEYEQQILLEQIEFTDATPSLSQAQRLRKFSKDGNFFVDTVFAVLNEEKPNQKEQVRFMEEDIRKYFPKSYTKSDIQKTILMTYAKKNGYLHPQFFVDDGISGTTFNRPGFQEMESLIEAGKVSTVIVKDLVYCADCGSKLHFCASKSLKKNQEFWRCSSYKDGRGTCTIHFIRDVVLEAIVKEAISELADFVRCYNSAFLYLISEKKGAESINREKSLRAKTESAKQRISDLDKLFSRIYEDNILGKLSDERYSRMANEYEAEQKRLISEVEENEKVLIELQKQTVDMKMLYQGLMEFTEMKQLTPTVVNKLIERIEIHNNEKKHSHNNVKVDIYFTAAGLFDIPTEQQLIDTMERVKQKKAEKSA